MKRSCNPILYIILQLRVLIFLLLTLLFYIPVGVAGLLSPDRSAAHRLAAVWGWLSLRIFGVKVLRQKPQALPESPVLLLCNHLSYLDIPLLLGTVPLHFKFIADRGLFRIPLLGGFLRFCGYIPVSRSGLREVVAALDKAARQIQAGAGVLIFPEGAINRSGDCSTLFKVEFGFNKIAAKSGAPLFPVVIKGVDLWQQNLIGLSNRVGVDLTVPLITTEQLLKNNKKEITQLLKQLYSERISRMQPL